MDGVAEDRKDAAGIPIDENEGVAVDSIFASPADGEPRIRLFKVNIFRIAIPRYPRGQMILRVEQPGISGVGREQRQRPNRHKPSIVFGGAALNIADLVGEMEILARNVPFTRPPFDGLSAH